MGKNDLLAIIAASTEALRKKPAESRNSIIVTEICPESRSVEVYIVDANSVRASWRLIRSYREKIGALQAENERLRQAENERLVTMKSHAGGKGMKTNSELLELAAKAVGLPYVKPTPDYDGRYGLSAGSENPMRCKTWNPLTDDGDALRLAVKLRLAIRSLEKCVFVESDPETLLGQSQYSELEMYGNSDPYAATRRAIVRTAAAIGEAME